MIKYKNIDISGIETDSRKVTKGSLFFAIKGTNLDGHDYIESAIKNGAVAIVGEYDLQLNIPYFKSDNIRNELAITAAQFYKTQPKKVAAITGTNGKTSTADFCRQFFEYANQDSASIGTLGFIHGNKIIDLANTSPDPILLHQSLAQVKDFASIEASSIGLEQHRLDGVNITAAAFTNFTQDHLDYHKTMEEYFRCKTLLFSEVMKNGTAVLNSRLPKFYCPHEIITFGLDADLKLISQKLKYNGQDLEFEVFGKKIAFSTLLVGAFQADNILAAIGLAHACGLSKLSPELLKPISGRMQQAANGIYVDYAHTPDALENALKSLRAHTKGKLLVVFGCGGDRDKSKRPQMGKIANQLADIVFITDDNPRTENAAQIRQEIITQAISATEIPDRKQAISHAISCLQPEDILLIAGKGHEKYQIYGNEKIYFDDVAIAQSIAN